MNRGAADRLCQEIGCNPGHLGILFLGIGWGVQTEGTACAKVLRQKLLTS